MAGAFTNRHTNLKKIIEGYETLVEAALASGVSANYLSQLKGGKHIGHVMARLLPARLGAEPRKRSRSRCDANFVDCDKPDHN